MHTHPEAHATAWPHRAFTALAVSAFLIGIAIPAGLLIWRATAPTVAMLQGSAGTLVATRVGPSVFGLDTLTRVDTSTGSAVVQGPFSGNRGSPLTIAQINKRPGWRLCVAGSSAACAPLAGVWAGPLNPTAAAKTAVDFQRYGMTPDNLAGWMGLGLAGVGIFVLLGLVMRIGCVDAAACTHAERAT